MTLEFAERLGRAQSYTDRQWQSLADRPAHVIYLAMGAKEKGPWKG